MHLPVSSEDALHFYRYLCTHILIADEQFLLLIDVPIQYCTQQLKIYVVFNLAIPHRNFSACYNINNRYFVIMHDETKTVEISGEQFNTCQKANDSFAVLLHLSTTCKSTNVYSSFICKGQSWHWERWSLQIKKANSVSIPIPIAPNVWILTSVPAAVPTGITLNCPAEAPRFIKTQTPIHILNYPQLAVLNLTFHLPPCYETIELTINISLNTANLNVLNISSPEFRIWQHLEDHWNGIQLHHVVNIPSIPIDQLYKHMVSSNRPINPFMSTDESVRDTVPIWTLFSHTSIYATAIGLLISTGLGIFCCYFSCCWPFRLVHQPLQSGSMWYTICGW